jgi:TetR/AcrR family transcriptional regulator, tetracycline repressor protein
VLRQQLQLSREEIVDAAMQITRRDGLSGLTMRSLAEALGVAPSALYRHIDGRDALVAMVGDAVLNQIELPDHGSGTWEERLKAFSANIHRVLSCYPGLVPVLLGDPTTASLRIVGYAVDVLREAGLSARDAYRVFTIMSMQSAGRFTSLAPASPPPSQRSILPREVHVEGDSSLADIGDPVIDVDEIMAFGTELFLEGLSAIVAKQRSPGR